MIPRLRPQETQNNFDDMAPPGISLSCTREVLAEAGVPEADIAVLAGAEVHR